jgi:DNA-binding NarL/FixJ family response regulator
MSTTIVLADDHAIVCEGIRLLLEREQQFAVVGSATNGLDAVRCVEQLKPDVAILDIRMPGMNGIVATSQITERSPETRVIVLSMHGDSTHIYQALRSGAQGYVVKESAASELVAAIGTVMGGHRYLSPRLTDMLVEEYIAGPNGKLREMAHSVQLNPRELEILHFVAEGRSSASIAEQLGLATSTVDTYRSRMMQKLKVSSSAGLVKYAILNGLVNI